LWVVDDRGVVAAAASSIPFPRIFANREVVPDGLVVEEATHIQRGEVLREIGEIHPKRAVVALDIAELRQDN
jgi:hypothetical protein